MAEPFIDNWEKFNSNSGWAKFATPWPQVMQALSHYSYHATDGQLLLCDLQGGVYNDGVVLSDPVIISRSASAYGVTDLGLDGITSFFAHHVCTAYCRSSWARPKNAVVIFASVQGTTMRTCQPVCRGL
ncbi:kinase-like domain-containing protein [Pavlovales sp. CCMP2436]|nr:kinase-like domain-containing protein [Pavlovales sp. CCMP2436]